MSIDANDELLFESIRRPEVTLYSFEALNRPNFKSENYEVKELGLTQFFNFRRFNNIQSKSLLTLLYSNRSMIISSPTGSGKTVLFELGFIRVLQYMDAIRSRKIKAVYISPIKALCQEKLREWRDKFQNNNPNEIRVVEITGDTEAEEQENFQEANLIITTPEKWDAITRKWRDYFGLVSHIALLMIDEVHLLNTEERGATLEAVNISFY
jgi:ATP-dependent DNA helicase HFM1/MER3